MSHRVLPSRSRIAGRLRRRDESGAALVEFAIVAIPFFMILYGLIAFGMILALKQSVTNASAEGARSAVGSVDIAAARAAAKQTVAQRLDWVDDFNADDPTHFSAVEVECIPGGTVDLDCIKVTISYPYGTHPIVPPAPGLNLITPESVRSQSTVKFR